MRRSFLAARIAAVLRSFADWLSPDSARLAQVIEQFNENQDSVRFDLNGDTLEVRRK